MVTGVIRPNRFTRNLSRLVLLVVSASALYRRVIKPWQERWGATDEEFHQAMPGDEVVANPNYQTTHAITIKAPPGEVWPWLVQMGQGRGGLYSYDWLENLTGLNIHSAEHIIPELQTLKVGDVIPLAPDGTGPTVEQIDQNSLLVTAAHDQGFSLSWVWALRELDNGSTRLVARWRAHYNVWMSINKQTIEGLEESPLQTISSLLVMLFLGPGEFIMERQMLLGIKKRAERAWLLGESLKLYTAAC
jgi:hypothetical protein